MLRLRPSRLRELPVPAEGGSGWPWSLPAGVDGEGSEAPPEGGWPDVTLVTPSLNQARFLEASLRSVLLQGYPALEYLVMDGGSSDGSPEIIRRYAPFLSGWSSEPDRGQAHAINKGLARASGRIVGWLNSDDRLLPGALFAVARFAAANPGAVAWVGACRSVTSSGRLVYVQRPRGLTRDGLADWGGAGQISQPACFFSREAAARVGFLDERLHFCLDVDFWLRLAGQGPFAATEEPWAEETLHAAAKTSAERGRSLAELHLVQIRHGYEAIAMVQLGHELQEYETLRRGTLVERAKLHASLVLQPILWRLRRR
jgi:hypothetical protein